MADSFVDYIRRKRGYGGAVTEEEKKAVDTGFNYGGYTSSDRGQRGGWGSATAAQAARIGSNVGYTGGGPTSGPATGSTTGASSGGSSRSGIGSDYVAGASGNNGDYGSGMYSGGVYSTPRSVPTTTIPLAGSGYTGYGPTGGSKLPRGAVYDPTAQSEGITPRAVPTTTIPGATTGTSSASSTGGRYVPGGGAEAVRPIQRAAAGGGAGYGPYGGSGSGGFTAPNTSQFFDAVMRSEGTSPANHPGAKGYNEVMGYGKYGGYPEKGLTNMTLQEAYDFGQKTMLPNKLNSSAMGAFQITSTNIKALANMFGDDMNTVKFDPATQQRYALALATGADGSKLGIKHWEGLKLSKNKELAAMATKALAQIKAQGYTNFSSLKKFTSPYAPAARGQQVSSTTSTYSPPAARTGMMAVPTREQGGGGYGGSAYGAGVGNRGMGGTGGGQYGGGYGGGGGFGGGGTYGGSAGKNINQGVGGSYKNR